MRKLITIFLILAMSFSLCACGTKEPTSNNDVQQETEQSTESSTEQFESDEAGSNEAETSTSEESIEPEEPEFLTAFDGKSPKIPYDVFGADYLEVIEITSDNWKDYFEVVCDEDKRYNLELRVSDLEQSVFAYQLLDSEAEWKIVKENSSLNGKIVTGTGTLISQPDNKENLEYTTEDFECISFKGQLAVANFPEELWSTDEKGNVVVYIGSNSGEYGIHRGLDNQLTVYVKKYKTEQ